MKFFIDTADLDEIREAHAMGVLDGVTTNPSLMFKAGVRDFDAHIREICAITPGDVSAEITAMTFDAMMDEAHAVAKLADNVVVKVPLVLDGIKAIKALSAEGIRTNCTLCFSLPQALIAAKAGATYISPFIGRLDDIAYEGMDLIRQIVHVYATYGLETEVLAASIRHPLHVAQAAEAGADVATIPLDVIKKLLKHPLTDAGLKTFTDDWEKLQKANRETTEASSGDGAPAKGAKGKGTKAKKA
ncbi:MAG TPA: fructose-6-phosphate aldolase [Rubricoccaceae bacterium]|jgi:transaldolase